MSRAQEQEAEADRKATGVAAELPVLSGPAHYLAVLVALNSVATKDGRDVVCLHRAVGDDPADVARGVVESLGASVKRSPALDEAAAELVRSGYVRPDPSGEIVVVSAPFSRPRRGAWRRARSVIGLGLV